jgi:hypothetical protein
VRREVIDRVAQAPCDSHRISRQQPNSNRQDFAPRRADMRMLRIGSEQAGGKQVQRHIEKGMDHRADPFGLHARHAADELVHRRPQMFVKRLFVDPCSGTLSQDEPLVERLAVGTQGLD